MLITRYGTLHFFVCHVRHAHGLVFRFTLCRFPRHVVFSFFLRCSLTHSFELVIAAQQDVRGTTALHSAVFNWKMPNVRALVAAGARIRKNAVGLTPLHVSFKADKDEESAAMLRVLLKCRNAKKKLDIVFREGNKTPLAVAVGANLIGEAFLCHLCSSSSLASWFLCLCACLWYFRIGTNASRGRCQRQF